jgi:AcrR family transcriptional regulator
MGTTRMATTTSNTNRTNMATADHLDNATQRRKTDRKPGSGADRRITLLDAAVEQIALRGTRGMRIEEVAKAAGVSPALLYHHFTDRSGLLTAALQHIGDRANVYTEPKGATARDKLINLLTSEVQDDPTVRTNSAAWGELRDSAIFDESLRPTLEAQTLRWIDDITSLVKAGQRDGSISTHMKPSNVGIRLSALVEGLSSRWLVGLLTTRETRRHIAESAQSLLGPPSPS